MKLSCTFLLGLVSIALAKMEGFVVGPNLATITNHPHSAFLSINCESRNGQKNYYICGSSLLNQQILLSAAHCFYGCSSRSHIKINLGNENRQMGQTSSAHSFEIHDDYSPKTCENDISLLRSKRTFILGLGVGRVAIMKKPPYNERATVAGWGLIDEVRQIQSDQLKFVVQQIWSRSRCVDAFGHIPKGTICAAHPKTTAYYASEGDSGSALIVRGFIQIGIVSCKVPYIGRHIVIYTDVAHFYDWIQINAKKLACV